MAHRVCPYWLGYWLISPLRRFMHDPEQILSPYVRPGNTVLEIGPGMGYFTLPLAELVGTQGKVVCVDVQEKMIRALQKRLVKASLLDRTEISRILSVLLIITGRLILFYSLRWFMKSRTYSRSNAGTG